MNLCLEMGDSRNGTLVERGILPHPQPLPIGPFSASELSAGFGAGVRGVIMINPITVSNDTASSPYSTNLGMALTLPVRTASQPAAPFAAPGPSIRPIRAPHERLRPLRPFHPALVRLSPK